MAERADLEAAASAGVINAAQVGPLFDFLATRKAAGPRPTVSGEEDLRFIRNFHDVFLAVGIALFSIGMAVAIATYAGDNAANPQQGTITAGVGCLIAVALVWALGEFFARRRRLFLPAIAIVISLTVFAVFAAALLYTGALIGRGFEGNVANFESIPPEIRNGILLATVLAVIAPLAFYFRFRLPFSLGLAGAGAALFVIVACLIANFELTVQFLPSLYLLLGILLFIAGVLFDARDPSRATRFSDNGFWLHFAAAPLILNGAFGLVVQAFNGGNTAASVNAALMSGVGENNPAVAAQAAVTLAVILLIGVISLLINRRALIVSALLTTGIAIGVLFNAAGLGEGALVASILIVLGAFVLILGASWHVARRALLAWVKPGGLWARIFPPEIGAPA